MSCSTQDKIYLFCRDREEVDTVIKTWFGLMDKWVGDYGYWQEEATSLEITPDRNRYCTSRGARLDTNHYRVIVRFEWEWRQTAALRRAVAAFARTYPQWGIEHYNHITEEDYVYWIGLEAQWKHQRNGNGREWLGALLDKAHDALTKGDQP